MTTDLVPEIAIRSGRFQFSSRGLLVEGEPTYEEWEQCGVLLARAEKTVQWWVGDWVNFGEREYGEHYAQALDETRFTYGTLRNDAWVARRFAPDRRHEGLSFSHHREVAPLPAPDQDHWLAKAEQGDGDKAWSSKRLRQELRQAGHRLVPDSTDLGVHFSHNTDDWLTPRDVIDRVVKLFGVIDLDPCSCDPPNVPATRHFTKEHDGLVQEWTGRVYMHPPPGRSIIDWVAKLMNSSVEAIALLPARTDTDWFRLLRDCVICFIDGRLRFSNADNSAPFPSMIIYVGANESGFSEVFGDMGDIWVRLSRQGDN